MPKGPFNFAPKQSTSSPMKQAVGTEETNKFFNPVRTPGDEQGWDKVSPNLKSVVKELASMIFSDAGANKIIVTGTKGAGKSFLVNTFLRRREVLSTISKKDWTFVESNRANNMVKLSQLGEDPIKDYFHDDLDFYGLQEDSVCLVTDCPKTAFELAFTESAIIFEVDVDELKAIQESSVGRALTNFQVLNVDDVCEPRDALRDTIVDNLLPQMNSLYRDAPEEWMVDEFLDFYNGKILSENESDGYDCIPVGLWATAFSRAYGVFVVERMDAAPDNVFTFDQAVDKSSEYCVSILKMASDTIEKNRSIESEIEAMMGPLLAGMTGGSNKDESVDDEPKTFADIEDLNKALDSAVVGQEKALSQIKDSLIVPMAGLNDSNRPLKSMIFLGPTGVGKTKTAQIIAENLYTEPVKLIRMDMSEYQQEHEVSKLFGAPPGYVGSMNDGLLTGEVKRNPYSVVLFDEVEKAHPKIFDALLQILDAGRLTNNDGTVVDFSKTVVLMTSNLGSAEMNKNKIGFLNSGPVGASGSASTTESIVHTAMKDFFRPEMIARIDEKVVFDTLPDEAVKKIIRNEIVAVQDRMRNAGYVLYKPSDDILNYVMNDANVRQYGAREVKRVVHSKVISPLATAILKKENKNKGNIVRINKKKDGSFSVTVNKR